MEDQEFDLVGFLVSPLKSEDGKNYNLPKRIKCCECGRYIHTAEDTAIHTTLGWQCHNCYN